MTRQSMTNVPVRATAVLSVLALAATMALAQGKPPGGGGRWWWWQWKQAADGGRFQPVGAGDHGRQQGGRFPPDLPG